MEAHDINVLRFKIVTAKQTHQCDWCSAPIVKGMRYRKMVYTDRTDKRRPQRFHSELVHESHLKEDTTVAEMANEQAQIGACC